MVIINDGTLNHICDRLREIEERLDKIEGKDIRIITDISFKFHNIYFKNFNDVVRMFDDENLKSLDDMKNFNFGHNPVIYVDSDSPYAYALMYLLNHLVKCGYRLTDFSMNNIRLTKRSDH